MLKEWDCKWDDEMEEMGRKWEEKKKEKYEGNGKVLGR